MKKLLIALLFATSTTQAAEPQHLPQELAVKTDVGEVVITTSLCDATVPPAFIYRAYATEAIPSNPQPIIHEGCWYTEGMAVNIWFPEVNGTYTYSADLFKPHEEK